MLFTSESVSPGHPDKVCDQISDAVLDYVLTYDPKAKVACEVLACGKNIIIAGEINSPIKVDYPELVYQVLKDVEYVNSKEEFSAWTIQVLIQSQSPEINHSVLHALDKPKELGAGDQGMMFGYACNHTKNYMPLAIDVANALLKKAWKLKKAKQFPHALSDMKSQVTIDYTNFACPTVYSIVLSIQHEKQANMENFKNYIVENIIEPVLTEWNLKKSDNYKLFINPSGSFILGGPEADTGLTGRKIIVDSYGGWCSHGGGAFSGKDPSKVDRSAAYMARYIAKNLVANKLCEEVTVQLSYVIGVADPISINVNTFNTSSYSQDELIKIIKNNFELTPQAIIEKLNLYQPIYSKTATFGHFGQTEHDFSWEKIIKLKY